MATIDITAETFEETIEKNDIVIVDFWAPWCGPCRMVAPILEKIAKEYDGKVVVAKVNTDEDSKWAQKFGVRGIPTMLFISGGEILHQQVGALPEPMLKNVLNEFLDAIPVKE